MGLLTVRLLSHPVVVSSFGCNTNSQLFVWNASFYGCATCLSDIQASLFMGNRQGNFGVVEAVVGNYPLLGWCAISIKMRCLYNVDLISEIFPLKSSTLSNVWYGLRCSRINKVVVDCCGRFFIMLSFNLMNWVILDSRMHLVSSDIYCIWQDLDLYEPSLFNLPIITKEDTLNPRIHSI